MRSGTITAAVWNLDNSVGSAGNFFFSRSTMVRSSGASSASSRASSVAPPGSRFIHRRSEAVQSRASTRSPSWNRRFSRSVITQRLPSSSTT